MVMGVIKQFFQNVAWGELDVLIVDLPPGTGDAQLTMIQAVPISGAVIVTTPQKIAVLDAVRGVEMFKKLDVPLLGIVENMSFFEVGGVKAYPFGQGGGQNTATQYGTPLLAQVPLEEGIRLGGDMGLPSALSSDPIADPFLDIARQVDEMLFS
jgi:ATP-binding protein involved in chromosome partitioning